MTCRHVWEISGWRSIRALMRGMSWSLETMADLRTLSRFKGLIECRRRWAGELPVLDVGRALSDLTGVVAATNSKSDQRSAQEMASEARRYLGASQCDPNRAGHPVERCAGTVGISCTIGGGSMITITGKLIGCGAITTYDAVGRGLELEINGETVYLLGLTIEQCQELAPRVCEQISITVTSSEQQP